MLPERLTKAQPALALAQQWAWVGLNHAPGGIEGLSGHEHQIILTMLCDDVLSCEKLRDALQERIEGEGDVKREMREAVAEKKGELKVC